MLHVTRFFQLCNDLADTYCAFIQLGKSGKLEQSEETALACRLLNTVCTFIQIGQVQKNADTFEEAGQVLIACGSLIVDLLQRVGFENFPKEAHGAARTIMNILVTTPALKDQAKDTVEFCRAYWKETE